MKAADQMIRELSGQSLSDGEIAERLNAAGFTTKTNLPFKKDTVRCRRRRMRIHESETTEMSENSLAISDKPDISETRGPLPEEWRSEIIGIIQTEVKKIMEGQTIQKGQNELPPEPLKKVTKPPKEPGKKTRPSYPGDKLKIAGIVDKELANGMAAYCKKNGVTLSKALDRALWHFLGKPPLSFEISEKSDA